MHWHMQFEDSNTHEILLTRNELASALIDAGRYLAEAGRSVTFEACGEQCEGTS